MHKSVGVVDYGAGNILNVLRAFERHQIPAELVSEPSALSDHSHLVLPGVGSFRYGMKNLEQRNLSKTLVNMAQSGIPILGICLGMQLLADWGHENGRTRGLGLIKGEIIHLSGGRKSASDSRAPHTGWSAIDWSHPDGSLRSAYFNHSYFLAGASDEEVVATASVGAITIPAVVSSGAIFATQFHPEKSGEQGLALLEAGFATPKEHRREFQKVCVVSGQVSIVARSILIYLLVYNHSSGSTELT